MDIRNVNALKASARERLRGAPAEKKIVTMYVGITLAMTVLVTLAQYLLDLWIGKTSGLGSMGLRSVLSAVQTVLPIVQTGVGMCLGLGYMAAMLRVARGQYVSPRTLKLGFDRFWPLLRLSVLEGLITTGAAMVSLYAACAVYVLTPLSKGIMEILTPMLGQGGMLDTNALLEEGVYSQLISAMKPVMVMFLVMFCLVAVPVLFRYRMAQYVLIDKPGLGAMAALRESRKMMHRSCLKVLRVDLGLWWYHGAFFLLGFVSYGDQLLPMLGVTLPWSGEVSYYVFFAAYEIIQAALVIWLRNRVETTYALTYDALRPKEEPQNGVVLGNIFQM